MTRSRRRAAHRRHKGKRRNPAPRRVLTLMDWARQLDPDGKSAAVVEMLSRVNDILPDLLASWKRMDESIARSVAPAEAE